MKKEFMSTESKSHFQNLKKKALKKKYPSKINYTQGEWKVIKTEQTPNLLDLAIVAKDGDTTIGWVYNTSDEKRANAQLISAAPDMYEALKALLAESRRNSEGLEDTLLESIAAKAISKAEGNI